ncbi:MAG: GNAT family N-acetyltransferase [Eubacteriales bacterium]
MMHINLLKAEKKDVLILLEVQKLAFKPLYEIYHDEQSPYLHTTADMQARMDMPGSDCYKILLDETIVGVVRIVQHNPTRFQLVSVSILPEYQNRGIAQKAIALAESLYPEAQTWSLDFPIDRPMNKKCYENLGYRDTGRRERINERLTLAFYEKSVSMRA